MGRALNYEFYKDTWFSLAAAMSFVATLTSTFEVILAYKKGPGCTGEECLMLNMWSDITDSLNFGEKWNNTGWKNHTVRLHTPPSPSSLQLTYTNRASGQSRLILKEAYDSIESITYDYPDWTYRIVDQGD